MTETERRRRAAELRRILFLRMTDRLMDRGSWNDSDFEIVLAEVAAEMATEIQTFYAQRTADMLRDLGAKPH
jgi:hypothetical protein